MKSFLKPLTMLAIPALLLVSSDAQAFNRNISGSWLDAQGDRWTIAQLGGNCSFATSIRTNDTGLLTFTFAGYISDIGGDDEFSFNGVMEPKDVRIGKRNCRLTGGMSAAGDVAGEVGGRVIHMDSCTFRIHFNCGDKSDDLAMTCTGTWT